MQYTYIFFLNPQSVRTDMKKKEVKRKNEYFKRHGMEIRNNVYSSFIDFDYLFPCSHVGVINSIAGATSCRSVAWVGHEIPRNDPVECNEEEEWEEEEDDDGRQEVK